MVYCYISFEKESLKVKINSITPVPCINTLLNGQGPYQPKIVIANTLEWALQNYPADVLDTQRIFLVFVDKTSAEDIDKVISSEDITNHYEGCTHTLSRVLYVGNFDKKNQESVVRQYLKYWFGNYIKIDEESA